MSKRILFDNLGSIFKVEDPNSSKVPLNVLDTGISINSNITIGDDIIIINSGSIFVDGESNINIGGDTLNEHVSGLISASSVPSSRLIGTSTGLIGGGDLSADRILSVDSTVLLSTQDNIMGNNNSISFGTGNTFSLYHNAANGVIDVEESNLLIRAQDNTSTFFNTLTINGGLASGPTVSLYADGNAELSTVSGGGVVIQNDLIIGGGLEVGDNINMGANKVVSLGDPTSDTDAVNLRSTITRQDSLSPTLKYKIIEIGGWDMVNDSTPPVALSHDLPLSVNVVSVTAVIQDDPTNQHSDILEGGHVRVNPTTVVPVRDLGGRFDSVSFDDDTINRGWITIMYIS